MFRAAIRRLAAASAIAALLSTASACAATSDAPPPPSADQLRVLVSQASGAGDDGYQTFNASLVRFVSDSDWPKIGTACIEAQGITGVDLATAQGAYWSPTSAQGAVALNAALIKCRLMYPSARLRSELHTARQWQYEYAYLQTTFRACVEANRASVAPLPSRARYLAAAEALDPPDAYAALRLPPFGLTRTGLELKCPASAPGF